MDNNINKKFIEYIIKNNRFNEMNHDLYHGDNYEHFFDLYEVKDINDCNKTFESDQIKTFESFRENNPNITHFLIGFYYNSLIDDEIESYSDYAFFDDGEFKKYNSYGIKLSLLEIFTCGKPILSFNIDDWETQQNRQEKLFRDINETVGSNFNQAKKEFLNLVYDRYNNGGNNNREYELRKKEGMFVIFIIGKLNNEEFYYDKGYIYGRTGWKFISDMETIVNNKDKLEKIIRFTFNDYVKVDKQNTKLFNDINESNKEYSRFGSETLLDWISTKLQHKIGERIGKGVEGVVHKYSKGRVIKITSENVIQQYKLLNKNIKGIAKIYHIGLIEVPKRFFHKIQDNVVSIGGESKIKGFSDFKNSNHNIEIYRNNNIGYVIMEEVDTSVYMRLKSVSQDLYNGFIKEDEDGLIGFDHLPQILKKVLSENLGPDFKLINKISIFGIINLFSIEGSVLFKRHLKEYYNLDGIIYELIDVLYNISKYYRWEDVHAGQFGKNSKGELVAFDIADDNDISPFGYYPIPKNIIKENIVNKNDIIDVNVIKKSFLQWIKDIKNKDNIKIGNNGYNIIDSECWLMYIDDLFKLDESQYIIKYKKIFSEPDVFLNDDIFEYYYYDISEKKFIICDESSYWYDLIEVDRYSYPLEDVYEVILQYNYNDFREIERKNYKLFNDINEEVMLFKNWIRFSFIV